MTGGYYHLSVHDIKDFDVLVSSVGSEYTIEMLAEDGAVCVNIMKDGDVVDSYVLGFEEE